jgi:hypothetical protein
MSYKKSDPLYNALQQSLWLNSLTKLFAVALIAVGVWMSYALYKQLLGLIHDSQGVKALALRLEKESGLNQSVNTFLFETREQSLRALSAQHNASQAPTSLAAQASAPPQGFPIQERYARMHAAEKIDLMYLFAWLLFLLILGAGVRIALAILHKGAKILIQSSTPSDEMRALMLAIRKQQKDDNESF